MGRWSAPSRTSGPGVYRSPSLVPYARRQPPLPAKTNPGLLRRITETGAARTLTFYKVVTLTRITETGTARPIGIYRSVTLTRITETGTARALTFSSRPSGHVLEPQLIIEVAFNVGASTSSYLTIGDPTRGLIGTGTIAPSAVGPLGGVWTDVTEYVKTWGVRRGSTRVDVPVVRYEPGTATIVLENHDRRFDPTNLDGPYVSAGRTQVTPMRAVRIREVWADQTYEIFQGFADSWDLEWQDPGYGLCTLTCTDAMKVLSGVRRTAVAAAGAGELTGARVNRILDSVAWSDGDRMVDAGAVTVQATTLDGDALSELQLTADTEIGELYVDGGGRVVFRDRAARTDDSRSAISQATFGDDDDAGELPYTDLAISYDDSTFFNEVKITREGGAEQTASDASSQALYMVRTYERTDLVMDSDGQALTYAQYIIARTAEPELRFNQMSVDPRLQPSALYPQVLGRDFGDRITIYRRPPGGGNPIVRDSWIRGVEHSGGQGERRAVWTLQEAEEGDAPPAAMGRAGQAVRRRVVLRRDREWWPYGRRVAAVPPARR